MSGPDVSVVVPAYNVAPYLRRCLDSLLAQTLKSLEVIVVDDRSADDTPAVLAKFAGVGNLRVLRPERNGGPMAARATGVAAAAGRYVGFVDGDDWVAPAMYADLRAAAETADADIAVCGMIFADDDGPTERTKVRFGERRTLDDRLLERFCDLEFGTGSLCNKLFARDLIAARVGPTAGPRFDANEDLVVCVGCFADARRAVLLSATHYRYYERPGSITRREDPAAAFSTLLRAYASCLETYAAELGDRAGLIDRLYRTQLRFPDYHVRDPAALGPFRDELAGSVRRIAAVRPDAVFEGLNPGLWPAETPPSVRESLTAAGAAVRTALRRRARVLAGAVQ